MQGKQWVLAVAVVALSFGACRAENLMKQGIEGEYCNDRDEDCREGHICDDGICRAVDGGGDQNCAEMCNHLEACDTGEENCEADCRATLAGTCDEALPCPWSTEAADAFGACILDLSCDEARGVDAPQFCYREVPIDPDREGRCDAFVAAADRCVAGVSTGAMRNRCFLLGRTNTDESWGRTDDCVERVADGLCAEIEDCFNTVFELDPAIELGESNIGSDLEPTNNGVLPPG